MISVKRMDSNARLQIERWDTSYKGNLNYKKILYRLDTDSLAHYFIRAYRRNNKSHKQFAYVLKDDNKILAFIIFVACKFPDKNTMFIQSIVTHPHYQHQGYATQLIKTILSEPLLYMDLEPDKIEAVVDIDNEASLNLFNKFADFYKTKYVDRYIIAANYLNIKNNVLDI